MNKAAAVPWHNSRLNRKVVSPLHEPRGTVALQEEAQAEHLVHEHRQGRVGDEGEHERIERVAEPAVRLRKNALTPPPLTRFRWHEPVLAHVGSRRRTVLGARRPRQVQDRKVFGCE